jgi:hypothetical protein
MATAVVTYERGTTYITNISDSETCHAVTGSLMVGGLMFDTIERYKPKGVDFVHLVQRDYNGVMYWHASKGRVINPWNGYGPNAKQNNILVHRGVRPSHFEGCIGPGFLGKGGKDPTLPSAPDVMADGPICMELIWENCGGAPNSKAGWSATALKVTFRVANAFPDRATLKKYGA